LLDTVLKGEISNIEAFNEKRNQLNQLILEHSQAYRQEIKDYIGRLVESGQADPQDARNIRWFVDEIALRGNATAPDLPSIVNRIDKDRALAIESESSGSPLNSQSL
jgi:hypothetical protein